MRVPQGTRLGHYEILAAIGAGGMGFLRAHHIRFVTRRAGYAEYVCDHCRHPFCFADAA